jgi:hypothetical protein
MTFATLRARVAGEVGLDTTNDATVLNAWINAAYKHVLGLFRWPWLLKNSIIQTVADITTGTVSINSGSTALTFSSAPSVSVANQYMIQFTATSDDWYLISSHTASSTSATLANAFVGAANISGASYICRKVYYSCPTDCDGIIDLRQARTDIQLTPIDIRTFDRYLPDPSATAEPSVFAMAGYDSSKNWQFTLYPTPTSVMNLQLRYYQMPADMSSDSDTPLLPEKFHDALVFLSLYDYGHPYIDDDRVASAKKRYDEILANMKVAYNPLPSQMSVLQPWDARTRHYRGHLPWPTNYPY